jgi:hypothetical protein
MIPTPAAEASVEPTPSSKGHFESTTVIYRQVANALHRNDYLTVEMIVSTGALT